MTFLITQASSSKSFHRYAARPLLSSSFSSSRDAASSKANKRPHRSREGISRDPAAAGPMLEEAQQRRLQWQTERQRVEEGRKLTRDEVYNRDRRPWHMRRSFMENYEKGQELLDLMKDPALRQRGEDDPIGPLKPSPVYMSKSMKESLPPALPRNVPKRVLDLYYKPTLDRAGLSGNQRNWNYPPEMKDRLKAGMQQRLERRAAKSAKSRKELMEEMIPTTVPDEEIKRKDPIQWKADSVGMNNEGFKFFMQDVDKELRAAVTEGAPPEENEVLPTMPIGRVVEIRRSGEISIGLVVGTVLSGGKARMLTMRTSGEVWSTSPYDVQFVMPSSLVPESLFRQCFPPDIVAKLMDSDSNTAFRLSRAGANGEPSEAELARQQIVSIMRRVQRETEKMTQRMVSGMAARGKGGGVEAVWEACVPLQESEHSTITSAEAAEWMLNDEGSSQVKVKPHTLPAFAAHKLLMKRSDLFMGTPHEMGVSGRFLVRSRNERRRLDDVAALVSIDSKDTALISFVEKAETVMKAVREARTENAGEGLRVHTPTDLPEWNDKDLDLIATLTQPLYETRSTQITPALSAATLIARDLGRGEQVSWDTDDFARCLIDLGVLPPFDSMARSEQLEDARRGQAMLAKRASPSTDLLRGDELDSLRHDFSSHKIYVVDDATASELDDGIALESISGSDDVWVHVHVADPSRYLHPNHPASMTAAARGASGYFPEGGIPLFDMDVVMKKLSLGSTNGQGTVVFSGRLRPNGEIADSLVRLGHIGQARVTTYDQVNEALGLYTAADVTRPFGMPEQERASTLVRQTAHLDEGDKTTLLRLQKLLFARKQNRFASAGFEWTGNCSESHLSIRSDLPRTPNLFDRSLLPKRSSTYTGKISLDYSVSKSPDMLDQMPSGMMVAECMIMAGWIAARFCADHNLPAPFAGSPRPTRVGGGDETLADLLADRSALGVIPFTKVVGTLGIAPNPLVTSIQPHWLIGYDKPGDGYLRATSPLRRFVDLLTHWQIKSALVANSSLDRSLAPRIDEEDVRHLSSVATMNSIAQRQAEKRAQGWWRAGLFAAQMGAGPAHFPRFSNPPIDLNTAVLDAQVVSAAAYSKAHVGSDSGQSYLVWVADLGIEARMVLPEEIDMPAGTQVKVRISGAQQWPNPLIRAILVQH